MTDVMMILGDFEFKISTAEFQSLDRRHRQRKAVHQRIGRKAASQHIGAELDTMRLSGHILPHWNGGWGQMDRLRSMANSGEPFTLIDGQGKNHGPWELIEVSEKNSDYFDGSPLRIDFNISLQEYGEDRGNGLDLLALGLSLASRFL
ncbi:MAG: phage tail protein [Pelagimonas sp.]|jgi:phage protein U|nr:phage tail protein [Pelagimonas sp.]